MLICCVYVCYLKIDSNVFVGINYWKIKHKINEQQNEQAMKHKFEQEMLLPQSSKSLLLDIDDKFITQSLDHFDPRNQVNKWDDVYKMERELANNCNGVWEI